MLCWEYLNGFATLFYWMCTGFLLLVLNERPYIFVAKAN